MLAALDPPPLPFPLPLLLRVEKFPRGNFSAGHRGA
jgi:hypothetical protein